MTLSWISAWLLLATLAAAALMLAGTELRAGGYAFLSMHLPLAVVEGLVTGNVVVLLRKVRPEVLRAPLLMPPAEVAPALDPLTVQS